MAGQCVSTNKLPREQPVVQDRQQRIRVLRHLMAALSSLVVIAMVWLFAVFGHLPYSVATWFAVCTLSCFGFFTICFQTGLNRKLSDPSMTVPQLICAGVMLAYAAYYAGEVRGLLIPLYMIGLMFGTFRLTSWQLLWMSGFYIFGYGLATLLSIGTAERWTAYQLSRELLQYIELAAVLSWFAWMGGYVRSLGAKLRVANEELKAALKKIELVANYDDLTGVCNRRMIRELLATEKKRCDRTGGGLCVALLDLDDFKLVNDRFGHGTGDQVLQDFGVILLQSVRETDAVGRYGGEEFLIAFSATMKEQTLMPLERIRQTIEGAKIKGLPPGVSVTVSIGVSQYRAGEEIDETVRRADMALYRAKQQGRNRVVLDEEALAPSSSSSVLPASTEN